MGLVENLRKQLVLAKRMAQYAETESERNRLLDAIIQLEGAIIKLEQIRIEVADELEAMKKVN